MRSSALISCFIHAAITDFPNREIYRQEGKYAQELYLTSTNLDKLTSNKADSSCLCPQATRFSGRSIFRSEERKASYLLYGSALCKHLHSPAGKDPFCCEACCNWRIWKQSFKQFMVAMEVALSINRSWSKDVRWPETGRHSMLLIKSLCWPSACDIIYQTKQVCIRRWRKLLRDVPHMQTQSPTWLNDNKTKMS